MIASRNFLRADWGRNAAFLITTVASCNLWFYFRVKQYASDILTLNNDTMVLYQDFKYLYDSFFTFGQFPLWNPHILYGNSALYVYTQHSSLELLSIIFGQLLKVENPYLVFNAVLAAEQCIFVLGVVLLLWRFDTRWVVLLLLLPVLLLPTSYPFSVWHTQRCVYLMPFLMYFTIDFVRHGRMLGLVGGLVTWAACLFGNIPYEVVFVFYASTLFFFALALTNAPGPGLSQILVNSWNRLDWRILAALGLALLVTFLYYYVLASDRLLGHSDILRAGRDASLKMSLDMFVYTNTLEFPHLASLPVTLFTLDYAFHGQPFIGVINTYFLVYLLAGRLTKFVKIALLLMLFGLLFISSKWFLVKYILYWFPGAAYYHQFTPIVMIAKVTLVILVALGFTNFVRDLVKGEFSLSPLRLAVAVAAAILLISAFQQAWMRPIIPQTYAEAQVTAILGSVLAIVGMGWGVQRYASIFKNRSALVVLAGLGLAVINFGLILDLAAEHSRFIRNADPTKENLTDGQIKRNFFVRPFELPVSRSQDIYDGKLPSVRSVNSSWLSAIGAYPCVTLLGTNTISKAVANFFEFSTKMFPGRDYLVYLVEGTGPGIDAISKNPVARKYLACDLPIVRLSTNVAVVDSTDRADKLLLSVFQGERDFVDVVVDDTAASAARTERLGAAKASTSSQVESRVETILYSPNRVVFRAHAADDAWLIFTDGFDNRWTATVDGAASKVHIANGGFKAVFVPAGSHEVAFVYRNPAGTLVIWSLVVLLPVSLLLCIWLALRDLWARPARPPFPA